MATSWTIETATISLVIYNNQEGNEPDFRANEQQKKVEIARL